jgi:catechol 2,3-dioxygenase-like lactoylglutathione lyase family enzyme
MILGLSHMGLTVSKLDSSLDYYRKNLGLKVLSDAERKGEWVEKITGIPGFHTRTVYLSLSPCHHFEIFGFFHPQAISPERESRFRVGILGCVLNTAQLESLPVRDDLEEAQRWAPLLGREEEPFSGCRVVHLKDPDGLSLRVLEEKIGRMKTLSSSAADLRYPVFLVENMETSLSFYGDLLGLRIDGQGKNSSEEIEVKSATSGRSVRWAVLRGNAGFCLKLVSPSDSEILPALPWKMQKIGFTHAAFGVENLGEYYLKLKDKVNFKSAPTSVSAGPHQGGQAVYLTSPEGIILEFIDSPLIRESWEMKYNP